MKCQVTIYCELAFLVDVTDQNSADLEKWLQKLEAAPSPATSAYELSLSSMVGRVSLQSQATEAHVQAACRLCGCTDDNCDQCVKKTGSPCHWVEDDLCSACTVSPETERQP